MLKLSNYLLISLMLICCFSCNKETQIDYTQYVNPFIGNADNGHTFPGACVPFGLVQVSPQSGIGSWRYCSGYNFDDDSIRGFAHTHLNGTGVPDLGDVLIYPFVGELTSDDNKSKYDKKTQKAAPGYYSVTLTDSDIDVELTATQRTAFHCYTFHKNENPRILIDLHNGLGTPHRILATEFDIVDNYTITGHHTSSAWVEREVFYVIKFNAPFRLINEIENPENPLMKKIVLEFDSKSRKELSVKVGISTVSIEGAMTSLEVESPGWDFEGLRKKARELWNDLLTKVDVKGTLDQKINFYTSMYHLFIQPNDITDTDGKYRGADNNVYVASNGKYHSTFSLWDTYRAAHPLYTILTPDKVGDMITSMLEHHKTHGYLPIWTLWGKENHCMIGNHAVPVIVDAYLKGIAGFDAEKAYDAIKTSLTVSHLNSDWETYLKYGYYPFDKIDVESVSRTLESVYDDYCAAQMAKALGKTNDYEAFTKRSNFYKNLFDPETKLMRGKDSNGKWRTPFNSLELSHASTSGGDYTEGNAWQYTWHVQHDVPGLIELMGGKDIFANKLDTLFFLESTVEHTGFVGDVTGLIGQYAHGNEPSHHVAYLYTYVDQAWKTQELIREIFDRFYLPKPDGLCGNDDCGQMSAWYIFSAMGFYPVNPASGEYIIGAPQIEEITVHLDNGKLFTVKAEGLSEENKYVSSVELNGSPINDFRIHHKDIMNGGTLKFTMTSKL